MVKWVIIGVLLLPLAEIVAFLIVAAVIGGIWALLLMLATSLAGVMVLRRAGRARIARLRVAVADSDNTWIEANTGGSLKVLAGVLLFLPGFLTDLMGLALLIGPVRRSFGGLFRRWVSRRTQADRLVIDLAPSEWAQVSDRSSANSPKDRTRPQAASRPTGRSKKPVRD
jgi:UPF0716 family protein affecting phage T7 exclusion